MSDGRVQHTFRATGIDGDATRELAVKVDSTYERLDTFLDGLLNDPSMARALSEDTEGTLRKFGIEVENVTGLELVLPDPIAVRRGFDSTIPAVQPGVSVSTRASAGVALVEVAVAISLWVWAGVVGASGHCPKTRTLSW